MAKHIAIKQNIQTILTRAKTKNLISLKKLKMKGKLAPQVHREHQTGATYYLCTIEASAFQHPKHLLHCHFQAQ